jgi:hypothetical protein
MMRRTYLQNFLHAGTSGFVSACEKSQALFPQQFQWNMLICKRSTFTSAYRKVCVAPDRLSPAFFQSAFFVGIKLDHFHTF